MDKASIIKLALKARKVKGPAMGANPFPGSTNEPKTAVSKPPTSVSKKPDAVDNESQETVSVKGGKKPVVAPAKKKSTSAKGAVFWQQMKKRGA